MSHLVFLWFMPSLVSSSLVSSNQLPQSLVQVFLIVLSLCRFCRLIVFALSSHVPQVKSCCVEFCTSVCLWLWILFLDVIYLAFFINSTCFVCLACLFFGIWIPDFACNPASPSWFPAFRTSTMHIHDTNLGLKQGTDFETLTKD